MVSGDSGNEGRSDTQGNGLPRSLRVAGATLAVLAILLGLAIALTFGGRSLIAALLPGDSESGPDTTTSVPAVTTTEGSGDEVACGVYQGVVCEGAFTDEPGVAIDRRHIEDDVLAVWTEHDVELALVVVQNSRGDVPNDFAIATATQVAHIGTYALAERVHEGAHIAGYGRPEISHDGPC